MLITILRVLFTCTAFLSRTGIGRVFLALVGIVIVFSCVRHLLGPATEQMALLGFVLLFLLMVYRLLLSSHR